MSDSLRPLGLYHGFLQARILEWVGVPFSRGDRTGVPWIAGRFFTSWATREALKVALSFPDFPLCPQHSTRCLVMDSLPSMGCLALKSHTASCKDSSSALNLSNSRMSYLTLVLFRHGSLSTPSDYSFQSTSLIMWNSSP